MTQEKDIIQTDKNYLLTLEDIKNKVKTAQIKAHISVNKEMLILYWQIGKIIIEQRKTQKWGSKVIEQLAKDLKSEFDTMKGLSKRNLGYMASFNENYPDLLILKDIKQIGQQVVDQLEQEEKSIVQQTVAQLETNYFINDKFFLIFLGVIT